jgi:hypothetical protein
LARGSAEGRIRLRESFLLQFHLAHATLASVTIETFKKEIAASVKTYEKFIVCLEKSPEEFEASMKSLMEKAINAYNNRAEGMRHGLAIDRQVTIILSQSDSARPLCGIYFNLHSPYQRNALPSNVKPMPDKPTVEGD